MYMYTAENYQIRIGSDQETDMIRACGSCCIIHLGQHGKSGLEIMFFRYSNDNIAGLCIMPDSVPDMSDMDTMSYMMS